MKMVRLKTLLGTVARNPWSSLQDGLLLAMAMIVATLLAMEYDLFWFVSVLSEPQRRISLAEAIFLTVLLALCIVVFVIRRLHEERRDIARRVSTKIQLSELRMLASQDSLTMLANRRAMLKALTAAWGIVSCKSSLSAFGPLRGRVIFSHASAVMSSPCSHTMWTETPLMRSGCASS